MIHIPKPILLIILDGWGYRAESEHNPIQRVNTPTFDDLMQHYPHTLLQASGEAVNLPPGQIGNSEVGHLHIGSGRKVPQDLTRIDKAIASGEFYNNSVLLAAIEQAKRTNHATHILGLLSPGGVHSHEKQIMAMIKMIAKHDIKKNYLHAFLDGRDVPPKSALASLQRINKLYKSLPGGKIISIVGRYYAMDRDKRWSRTEQAYNLLTQGKCEFHAANAEQALSLAYEREETDEFVRPTSIHEKNESPIAIKDGDVVIFMNFRADRARQLTRALTEKNFNEFTREVVPQLQKFVTLTIYAKEIPADVAYPPLQLFNTLGEYLSQHHFKQLHIAETEKYAHVTYFLNGGRESPFPGEDRILIPSPKIATYDLQPEMSAIEITNQLVNVIKNKRYDAIMCNYANPDMVGHTGVEKAANQAVLVIDECIYRVIESLKQVGGEVLITADHGNIEQMYDKKTQQPHTAHTINPVPLIYVGRKSKFIIEDGALDDVAPTFLYLMGLEKPKEMTGRNLLRFT